MDIDRFRALLLARQRAACRAAEAEIPGEDSGLLDDLEAELFTSARAAEAEAWASRAASGRDAASARAVLAIVHEWGARAKVRALDVEIGRAHAAGGSDAALALAHERRSVLASRGGGGKGGGILAAAARVRALAWPEILREAHQVLAITEEAAGRMLGPPARRAADARGQGASARRTLPRGFTALVGKLTEGVAPETADVPVAAGAQAALEIARGLGLGGPLERALGIVPPGVAPPSHWAGRGRPREEAGVLEEDPPERVRLVPGLRGGFEGLSETLGAAGVALAALGRAPGLPPELRLWSDPALGSALGDILSHLAPEHAALRSAAPSARRLAGARRAVVGRLAAVRTIERHALLAAGDASREDGTAGVAAPGRVGALALPAYEEAIFDGLDRFRAALFAAPLEDRLRTRFGNLWYRDRAAGRLLKELSEAGGSIVVREAASALSISEGSADWLLDAWQEEERRRS